jgi:hypothetical protein
VAAGARECERGRREREKAESDPQFQHGALFHRADRNGCNGHGTLAGKGGRKVNGGELPPPSILKQAFKLVTLGLFAAVALHALALELAGAADGGGALAGALLDGFS